MTSTVETTSPPALHRGPEVLAVLGVSLGMSGIYAVLSYLKAELTVRGGISATTATVASGARTARMWLDIAYDVTGVVQGLMPVLLVRSTAPMSLVSPTFSTFSLTPA